MIVANHIKHIDIYYIIIIESKDGNTKLFFIYCQKSSIHYQEIC
jgi:hypothetical protein